MNRIKLWRAVCSQLEREAGSSDCEQRQSDSILKQSLPCPTLLITDACRSKAPAAEAAEAVEAAGAISFLVKRRPQDASVRKIKRQVYLLNGKSLAHTKDRSISLIFAVFAVMD